MKKCLIIPVLIMLLCFGCSTTKGNVYNVSLYKSVAPEEGITYVVGHINPDTDTVSTAIAYAKLRTALGFDTVAVIPGKLNKESKFVLDYFKVETPELLEDATGKNIILVDHADFQQAVPGMENANIIEILDHHQPAGLSFEENLIYRSAPIGATATMLYYEFKQNHVSIDRKTAGLLAAAIMSDTNNLKKERTTDADRAALEALCKKAGIQKPKKFYKAMKVARNSFDGLTDEEILLINYKEFEFSGHIVGIASVDNPDDDTLWEFVDRMDKALAAYLPKTDAEHIFMKLDVDWDELGEDSTVLLCCGKGAEEVAKKSFPDGQIENNHLVCTPKLNRTNDVVPALKDTYEGMAK
jgi:manganese-dependent inorganic pyrophosphatase